MGKALAEGDFKRKQYLGPRKQMREANYMRRRIVLALLLSFLGGGLFLASCSRDPQRRRETSQGMEGHTMPPEWKFTLPQGNPTEGREVFVKMECYKCHEVKGEKFPAVAEGERGVGAELSQMAGMHPVEFFAESVINPNAVVDPDAKEKGYLGTDGKSKMPNYNDLLTVKQVADLAAYLASLKGEQDKSR